MITSLPDAFLDIIVKYKELKETGNINTEIKIKIGGNATNFSIGLGILNVENNLIFHSGELIKNILEKFVKENNLKINLYWVKTEDSITVSLEKEERVMFTDPKGIQINRIEKYEDLIRNSEYIFFGNWNNNKKSNELLNWILEINKGKVYLDIGDPSINYDKINELIEIIKGKIWVLSLNEYELNFLSDFLEIKGNLIEKAIKLYEILKVENLDIHSHNFNLSLPSKEIIYFEEIKNPLIKTGAGDFWNSANFYGYINNFDNRKRLEFANEFAQKYIKKELNLFY